MATHQEVSSDSSSSLFLTGDDSLQDLFLAYFNQFGAKMCCFDDLIPYTEILKPGEVEAVRTKVEEVAAKKDNLVCFLSSSSLIILITAERSSSFCSLSTTLDESSTLSRSFATFRQSKQPKKRLRQRKITSNDTSPLYLSVRRCQISQ